MYKFLGIFLVLILLITACAQPLSSAKLRIITEDVSLLNFVDEGGNITGQSTEIVRAILKNLNQNTTIEVMPWNEGYDLLSKGPNIALYSTVRSLPREDLFKWVGPLGDYNLWLYAKKGSGITGINNLDDAKKVTSIGVYKEDIGQQFLEQQGFKNLVVSDSAIDSLKKLMSGEVSLWIASREELPMLAGKAGISADEVEPVFFVWKVETYMAFSKDVSDTVITQWQQQLEALKKYMEPEGITTYQKIISQYSEPQYCQGITTREQIIQLVDKTAEDIVLDSKGTFAKINAAEPPYMDKDNKDLYVFVYDSNVNMMAYAANPSVVGMNLRGKPDVMGNKFRDNIVDGALKNGSGWVEYVYTWTGATGLYYKTAYYKLAKGSDGNQYAVSASMCRPKP